MRKAIGIVGGMGPEASVYLYRLLIEKAISDFDAKHNDEFPEILLHSIPVPDFISSNKEKERALRMLQDRVTLLNNTNISCLAIACNTAHVLLPELQKASDVPFISMITAVVAQVKESNIRTVGILGTPSTLKAKLYHEALASEGINVIEPAIQDFPLLEHAIRNVIGGTASRVDSENLNRIADTFTAQGAEGIILGCTELPLVFPEKYSLPVFNSVEILALALLKKYYKIQKG